MFCVRVWAGPLSVRSEDIWHIFPDTEAMVSWLNILVLEIRHRRALIPLLRKGNESIGCVQLGGVRRSEVFVLDRKGVV